MTAPADAYTTTAARAAAVWSPRLVRLTAGSLAILALVQATLAGHMLSGHAAARSVHATLGTEVITWLAVVQLVAAICYWLGAKGPRWPAALSAGLIGVLALQIIWGFDGRLTLHLPVGVGFLGAQLLLITSLSPTRSRGPSRSRPGARS